MPPTAQQAMPAQVNPALMQALRNRAALGAAGTPTGPAPNSMNAPVQARPQVPGSPMQPPAVNTPGGGTPAQQVMKAAGTAQSPMMDDQTRQIAKSLIQKLMQHM